METERRYLLHLVGLGRLTPAEAERLLIVGNEGRETRWILTACMVLALLGEIHAGQWLPGLLQHMRLLFGAWIALRHAVSLGHQVWGGML